MDLDGQRIDSLSHNTEKVQNWGKREWIQFFAGCGIPPDVAATYGLIFNENRIQKNMLLDLNKEYLRDMGITVMGDIIAILRHAKVVHDKFVREQILSEPTEKVTADNDINDGKATSKSSTPVKRMLEHYMRKFESSEFSVPHETVQIQIENDISTVNVPKKLVHRIGVQNKQGVKRKIEAPTMKSDNLVSGKLDVPVPKLRRSLPEKKGSFTVKMPSGTTERSKKLLEKAKLKQNKTVFDRLGESSVSSTSDVTSPPITGSTAHLGKFAGSKDKTTSSVFSRLGEKSQLVTSTSNGEVNDITDQLPYRGILKTDSSKKKLRLSPNSTMRADNLSHMAKTNSNKMKKINLVKNRLGTNVKTSESSSPADANAKLNRLQITTTFEEETEPPLVQKLSKRFESIKPASMATNNENIRGGLGRSEIIQNKSKVSSTTQLPDIKRRGIKRSLQGIEPPLTEPDTPDLAQSKKVRFGRTTHRLIPGNVDEPRGATVKDFRNRTLVIGNNGKASKLTLSSGVQIGPLNSDKITQKPSLKDRIGERGPQDPWPSRVRRSGHRNSSML